MHNAPSWAVFADFGIIVRVMEGDFLVFHTGSGETHRLGPEAGFILDFLNSVKQAVSRELLLSQAKENGFAELDIETLEDLLLTLSALSLVKAG